MDPQRMNTDGGSKNEQTHNHHQQCRADEARA